MLNTPMSLAAAIGLLVATFTLPAGAAIAPGQVDDFEIGTLQSWQAGGFNNPNGPMNVASGGPDGANDNYMLLTANGVGPGGGKLVVFNFNQWAGNYLNADVGSIDMHVNNLGATNLVLRLILEGSAFQSLTTLSPVNVPALSGWNTVTFSLDPQNLTGGIFNTVMGNVTNLNLVHSPTVVSHRSFAPNIAAQLGVDNITAVEAVSGPATWNVDANGNWSQGSNWSGPVPNAAGTPALLGRIITQPRTVTVDVPITAGAIEFDNANRYTVAGTSALTLDAMTGDAQITVTTGSHTIAAPLTLADNTLVTVTPAASNLSITGALNASPVNLTKAGAGTLTVGNVRAMSLAINGGTVAVAPGGTNAGTSNLGALTLAGATNAWTAKYDLNDNDAVVRSSAPTKAADFARIYNQLKNGFAVGRWTGNGITSSEAAARFATTRDTGLSLGDNDLLDKTTFSGQTVDANSLLVKYTYYGDIDLDGDVDADDLTPFAINFGRTTGATQVNGDIDFDGDVDADDLTPFAINFGKGIGNPLAAGAEAAVSPAAVPEPSTIALAASAALLLLLVARRCPPRRAVAASRDRSFDML